MTPGWCCGAIRREITDWPRHPQPLHHSVRFGSIGEDAKDVADGMPRVRGWYLSESHLASQRGAAATEFAIISVVLLMLLLGAFSLGLTLYQHIALDGAAREAARFGATYPIDDAGGMEPWLRDVAQVAEDAATGALGASEGSREICIAFGSGDSASFSRIEVAGPTPISTATEQVGWCFENTAPSDDAVVQVRLSRAGWIEGIIYSAEPTLVGEATNRYERSAP